MMNSSLPAARGDLAACLFDIAESQIQLFPDPLQPFARTVHVMILGSTNASKL